MDRKEYGMAGLGILLSLAIAFAACFMTGCAYVGSNEVPHASAAISDECTTATVSIGSIGELSFAVTHSHAADGTTTGSVIITHTKQTLNAIGTGVIGTLAGFIAGQGIP